MPSHDQTQEKTQEIPIGAPISPIVNTIQNPDFVRSVLAILFSVSYILAVFLLIGFGISGFDFDGLVKISSITLSPLGALVGGIVGFYFGSKTKNSIK